MNDHAELANLGEHDLKAAIKSEWKKHEESAKQDLAPLLYYLRERLRAQGARNDLANTDRGFTVWVEANLDISRRTADRWCEWFAVEAGLKPGTSRQVTKSEDDAFYIAILNDHRSKKQIAFNCWVTKEVHAQFSKAVTKLQKQLNLDKSKDAIVQGVIYAAKAIATRLRAGHVRKRTTAKGTGLGAGPNTRRTRMGQATHARRADENRHVRKGDVQNTKSTNGHRGASGSKVMRAAAGR
jgi:hypothetical protein